MCHKTYDGFCQPAIEAHSRVPQEPLVTQNQKKTDGHSLQDRIESELADSFDEELEMEIDDDRLAKLLAQTADHPEREELDRRVYFKELFRLQGELVRLQDWVLHEKRKVVVIFEGRDAAGKGGVIKRIAQRLNPRVCRVAALPAPNERERTQWYFQRYVAHLPAGGEIVLFDRSWYNRAGVERVMEFCTPEQLKRFYDVTPAVEKAIVESGIILIKYWLEVSEEEQTRRLEARIDDPRKIWKLSPMDLKSYSRWYDYSRARDDMFKATDTPWAAWHVVRSDDKRRARLNLITHLLKQIPYKDLPRDKPGLPKREKAHGYVEPDYPYKLVPEQDWGGE